MKRIHDHWRLWWKEWSTWLIGVGSSVATFAPELSEVLLYAWATVPLDIKSTFSPEIIRYFGYAIAILAIPAKYIKQKSIDRDVAQ